MLRALVFTATCLAVPAVGLADPIYGLRTAHFFGGAPGPARDVNQSGVFSSATSETLPASIASGSTTFNGTASTQASPLELRAVNDVSAGSDVALAFNTAPYDPTTIVSIVQSRLDGIDTLVTGSTGTGYLLPILAIDGLLWDDHTQAFAQIAICAGNSSCVLSGGGNSTGGVQAITTTFQPGISAGTAFEFDAPFTSFFFGGVSVNSFSPGLLGAGGSVGGDVRFRLIGYEVVDINGDAIDGAVVHSALFPESVPEPATTLLMGLALTGAGIVGRRRR